MPMLNIINTLVISSILFLPQLAHAAIYYVATTGNDANSCSAAQNIATPRKTITNGITCMTAGAGDTLVIRGGTYSERIRDDQGTLLNAFPGGTSYANATTIKAYTGETVTLSGQAEAFTFQSSTSKYLIIQGLRLLNQTNNCVGTGSGATGGAHHIRFVNIECANSGHMGFSFGPYNVDTFFEVLGGSVHDNGVNAHNDHGFYIRSGSNLIDGVTVYNNYAYGIQFYNTDNAVNRANNNIVRNCIFHHNPKITDASSGAGILLGSGDNNTAYNNILYNNKWGIQVGYRCTNCKVFNNTIYNNGPGAAIGLGKDGNAVTNTTIRNNIFWRNTSDTVDSGPGTVTGTIVSHNLTSDPSFVNAASFNFRLQASSPAIDRGTGISAVPVDFVGTRRPQMNEYDIGSFEFTGGTAPAAPRGLKVQ
jgi:parallel beta-helix repeat protein